ncbi:dienelactone hydrolase family protein [Pseudomonas sp.]|uniref:dienelactone hydrolase family protein n=1 Tax=Pseudomonas sp. TaxID=306 RepID=UPI00272F8734|nr:dienelactone hydrolase family protein [Pseudomonas sp.]MDP2245180.1 dienelactone hydrolase family protein [Pseudomonas sp.]
MSGERVTIKTPDGEFSAYVARPAAAKAPAVVVIQEIFGVNAVMRDITDGLAAQGYLAICPDLFWRIEPGIDITDQSKAEWDKAFELFNAFDADKGAEDLQATITAIRADPGCTGKVGSVGFCLGGKMAFLTATRTDVDAAVSYYGVGLDSLTPEAEKLTRPVMLHIAGEDGFVPKEAQAAIHAALDNHPLITIHDYPGRDHAFARQGGEHFHAGDAETAGRRSLAFFAEHLG